jgi:hypothetical protein
MPDSKAKYNSTAWPLHEIRKEKGHGTVVVVIVFCILKPKLMKKTGAKNSEAKSRIKEITTKGRGQGQG